MQSEKKHLELAKMNIYQKNQWRKIIFNNEKKFNLDDLDEWQFYFRNLFNVRKWEVILSRQQMRQESVMICTAIGYHRNININ